MRVFISQPMNGRSNRAIVEERAAVIKACEEAGDEVIDSVMDMGPGSAIEYLAEAIKLLADADKVIMMKGWAKARGCRIEHEVAVQYGKEIEYA